MIRIYDKINEELKYLIEADCLIMSPEGAGQLLDELTDEFEIEVNMENVFDYMGMDVVISVKMAEDYRLARFINLEDF
ncbi:MAG: hypothetical protein WBP33_02920 [Saprospiraceae bacterium]